MKTATLVIALAVLCACKSKVSKDDCEKWKTHYFELRADGDKKVNACKPSESGKAMWKKSFDSDKETLETLCNKLDGMTPPTKEEAECFLSSKTPSDAKSCSKGEGPLVVFAHSAGSLDGATRAACEAK